MRAAASKLPVRARSWQSQRVTRLSFLLPGTLELAGTVFQPVPSHSGQTSSCALFTFNPGSSILLNSILLNSTLPETMFFDFAPARRLPASAKLEMPVYNLCSGRRACGGARKTDPALRFWVVGESDEIDHEGHEGTLRNPPKPRPS